MSASRSSGPAPRNQFSFSRLKTLHQCPLRYRFRYLKGLAESFRSVESFLGNTVHAVLEWLYAERDSRSEPTLAAVLEAFAEQWQRDWSDDIAVVRLAHDSDHYHRLGREMLERFLGDTFSRDRSTTVALEYRFNHRISPEIVFTGFADRVGRTEAGRLFVVDYKTSSRVGDPSDFSEGLQAPLYASCAMERHEVDETLAGYHYLRHGCTRWQAVSREHGAQLLERFRGMAEQALATTEFPARPGPLCSWCGYSTVCPEARVAEETSGGRRHTLERSPLLSG